MGRRLSGGEAKALGERANTGQSRSNPVKPSQTSPSPRLREQSLHLSLRQQRPRLSDRHAPPLAPAAAAQHAAKVEAHDAALGGMGWGGWGGLGGCGGRAVWVVWVGWGGVPMGCRLR
jgi:hypothetical protein